MTTLSIPMDILDALDDASTMVCVFCDESTTLPYCGRCQEYKGLMTIEEWEAYTGETWEE